MKPMSLSIIQSTVKEPHPAHARAGGFDVHAGFVIESCDRQSIGAATWTRPMQGDSCSRFQNGSSPICCNQQYSITAVTTSAGAVTERYAYTAYGLPTILDASASVLSTSAITNRYTSTGREWDATLALHHFRARWMSPIAGRFTTRDPIGFKGGTMDIYEYLNSGTLRKVDPHRLEGYRKPSEERCSKMTTCAGIAYREDESCCEEGVIVKKVPIWRCVENQLFGWSRCFDYSVGWFTCPLGYRIRHSYICCADDNQDCYQANNNSGGWIPNYRGRYWISYEPNTVRDWINWEGSCRKDLVCPKAKSNYCQARYITFSIFGPNCHHHSGNCGLGSWNW